VIISMTPLRVSFLGGGTDYPEHFSRHGGVTLASSIDKYTYITVTPLTSFFEHRLRVSYSRTELCKDPGEVQHPSVRECLRFLGIDGGVEIAVVADLPARTGLGSSSSFTVGLLHALHAFKGEMVAREQLAEEAVHVERDLIKDRVGLQDQYTCALGGLLKLEFSEGNRVMASPVVVEAARKQALQERLLIFYTGVQRSAHEVLAQQIERTKDGSNAQYLGRMQELARQGVSALGGQGDLREMGALLHEGWTLKRELSQTISNPLIDGAYARARKAGAIGGKLLGAGGGGFLLLYAEPYQQASVRKAMDGMLEVSFALENQGSRLIFYRP
jgi:D-glycero-alpha-D-manno-heptose-7-phosphate kinase